MKELIVAIQALFQQTFTYLDSLSSNLVKKLQQQHYSVVVDNFSEPEPLDLQPILDKLDEVSNRLTPKDFPDIPVPDLSELVALLQDIRTIVSRPNDNSLPKAVSELAARLEGLKPVPVVFPAPDTVLPAAISRLEAELTRLSQLQASFSEQQFKDLVEQLQKISSKPPLPMHMTGGMPVLSLGGLRINPSTTEKQDTGNTSLASIDTKMPASPATTGKQDTGNTSLSSIDTKTPALGQALAAASTPVVLPAAQIATLTPPAAITGFATETTLGTRLSESDFDTKIGSLTEAAPASDTASSGLNGRLQRIAQRLTALIALFPAALTGSGNFKIAVVEDTTTNKSVNVAQINGVAPSMGSGLNGTGVQRMTLATDQAALSTVGLFSVKIDQTTPGTTNGVSGPTLTKGTQGANGFSTQDLKDAGRTSIVLYATAAAAGTTGTETAITLTKSAGTGATANAVSFVVTSGKRFRIQQILVSAVGHATATTQATTFSFRLNAAGAVTTGSTPVLWKGRVQTPATSLAYQQISLEIPEGYEILGDGTLQIGMTANAVFTTNAPTWDVTIIGYEY